MKLTEFFLHEKAIGSYEHPRTHLAKKFAKDPGVDDPWALAQHIAGEGTVNEYEDPTSSKHDQGDSKWASPMSHKSGMPDEVPHDMAQQRAADGWKEMRKSSDSTYPVSSKKDLKGFFGDDPYPRQSEMGEAEGDKPSEDEPAWLKALYEPPGPEEPGQEEIDWKSLDDEGFLDKLSADKGPQAAAIPPKQSASPAPAAPPPGRDFEKEFEPFTGEVGAGPYSGPSAEDMTWDEIQATSPEEAAELRKDFPGDENMLGMAYFQKKPDGRIYMTTGDGERYAWLGKRVGWEALDDGGSPTGQFDVGEGVDEAHGERAASKEHGDDPEGHARHAKFRSTAEPTPDEWEGDEPGEGPHFEPAEQEWGDEGDLGTMLAPEPGGEFQGGHIDDFGGEDPEAMLGFGGLEGGAEPPEDLETGEPHPSHRLDVQFPKYEPKKKMGRRRH